MLIEGTSQAESSRRTPTASTTISQKPGTSVKGGLHSSTHASASGTGAI